MLSLNVYTVARLHGCTFAMNSLDVTGLKSASQSWHLKQFVCMLDECARQANLESSWEEGYQDYKTHARYALLRPRYEFAMWDIHANSFFYIRRRVICMWKKRKHYSSVAAWLKVLSIWDAARAQHYVLCHLQLCLQRAQPALSPVEPLACTTT